jgi:hypothetical protein
MSRIAEKLEFIMVRSVTVYSRAGIGRKEELRKCENFVEFEKFLVFL